jgi:hypothetical protein
MHIPSIANFKKKKLLGTEEHFYFIYFFDAGRTLLLRNRREIFPPRVSPLPFTIELLLY